MSNKLEVKDDVVGILLLAIKVGFLYKDIGNKILLDIFETQKYKSFELTVMKSNERAVKFYLKMGFTIVEEIIEDYGKNGNHESYNMVIKS